MNGRINSFRGTRIARANGARLFQLSSEKFLTYNRREKATALHFAIAHVPFRNRAAASSFARFRHSFSSCFRSTAFLEWLQLRRQVETSEIGEIGRWLVRNHGTTFAA